MIILSRTITRDYSDTFYDNRKSLNVSEICDIIEIVHTEPEG